MAGAVRGEILRGLGPVLPGVLAAICAVGGNGLAAVALLVVAIAWLLAGDGHRTLASLPAATVLLTFGCVAIAQLASLMGWRILAEPAAIRALLGSVGLTAAVVAVRRSRGHRGQDGTHGLVSRERPALMATAPAAVLAAYGFASFALPMPQRIEWFLNGDHVRHLWLLAEEWVTGYLEYSSATSPRAWHTLNAVIWAGGDPSQDSRGLVTLISDMSVTMWFSCAGLSLSSGLVAERLGRRCGLRGRWAGWAGLIAGSALLWPTFLGNYMALGFETAIFCALLLATAFLELLLRRGSLVSVVVTTAATTLVAHTWQLLLPAALVATSVAVSAYLSQGREKFRLGLALGVVITGAAVAWPSLYALTVRIGFGRASLPGPVPPIDLWLLLGLGSAVALGTLQRDRMVRLGALLAVGTACSAAVVAVRAGVPLSQYYPNKILWQATVMALPLLGVLVVKAATVVQGRTRQLWLGTASLVATAFVGISAVFPAMALVGHWSTVEGHAVIGIVASPGAETAQIVWTRGEPFDDVIARLLLDFYRAGSDAERSPAPRLTVEQECDLLRRAAKPAVVTTEDAQDVHRRYACVPDARLVPVSSL